MATIESITPPKGHALISPKIKMRSDMDREDFSTLMRNPNTHAVIV
jgi:hypothetical protein